MLINKNNSDVRVLEESAEGIFNKFLLSILYFAFKKEGLFLLKQMS